MTGGGNEDREREIYLGAKSSHSLFFKVTIGGFLPVGLEGYWGVENRV